MTIGRWLTTGFPLVLIGGVWLYFGLAQGGEQPDIAFMATVGGFYLLSGLIALCNKPWCRIVARIAWYPLLLGFPIGTVLGIMALRILHEDPGTVRRFHESVERLSSEQVAAIVGREAISRFGIQENQFGDPLAGSLRIAPGEVNGFMDDLETDYGFDLSDNARLSMASVSDIIAVLSRGGN